MIVKGYTRLNEKAVQDILELESVCKEYDNLKGSAFIDSSLNFNHEIQSFFLLYEKRELISMLAMFIPSEHEAEITALTLPKYRHNGYFNVLLSKAVEELRKFRIPEILFVCETQSHSGKQVLNNLGAQHSHTEYFMRLDQNRFFENEAGEKRLLFRKAVPLDLDKLVSASMRIFEDSFDDARIFIENCFAARSRQQYLALLNDEIVGMVSANEEGDEATIFGFGILPELRSKGYGKELLHLIIESLRQDGKTQITLEVNSENDRAFELYKKSGFRVEAAYEYYRKMTADLPAAKEGPLMNEK
jgi:ribosomal protein S18 acetylase RimI-like enzyme